MAGEDVIKERILGELRAAIKTMPDLSTVTMRMIKDCISPKFGDEWDVIVAKYKGFIKDQSIALISEAQKSPEKSKKSKCEFKEKDTTPSTVKKKNESKIDFEPKNSVSRDGSDERCSNDFKECTKKSPHNEKHSRETIAKSSDDGNDGDFKETKSRSKKNTKRVTSTEYSAEEDDFKESMKSSSKVSKVNREKFIKKTKDSTETHESIQKANANPSVSSPEILRLKSLAKQCGYFLGNLYLNAF